MAERESNYELQKRLIEEAMTALGADKEHKSAAIRQWISEKYPDEALRLASSWGTYFTAITQDPTTRIERTPGRYTFFLRASDAPSPPEASAPETGPPEDKEPVQRKQREQLLYPPLAAWLSAQGFPAEVTAATKKGGIWGNPDVAGLKIVDGPLGSKTIELATIEAKLSSLYWKYYFFEAVAHKRFSHRVYFAFAVGTDEPSLTDVADASKMREYKKVRRRHPRDIHPHNGVQQPDQRNEAHDRR